MASVRFSAVGGEIKGKINGTAFQGGKSGPSVKRVIHRSFQRLLALIYGGPGTTVDFGGEYPLTWETRKCFMYSNGMHNANPEPNRKTTLSGVLGKAWRDLTQPQRDAWNASAMNFTANNRFGDVYTPSGRQVFNQLNFNLLNSNQSTLLEWPPAKRKPASPVIAQDPAQPEVLAFILPEGIAADTVVQVWSGPGQSKGRSGEPKGMKLIGMLSGEEITDSVNMQFMWQLFFGLARPNTNVPFKFVAVDTISGEKSQPTVLNIPLSDAVAHGLYTSSLNPIAMGNVVVDEDSFINTVLSGYSVPVSTVIDFTGSEGAAFTLRYNNAGAYEASKTIASNQWNNMWPINANLKAHIIDAGPFTANIRLTNPFSGYSVEIPITGTGVSG